MTIRKTSLVAATIVALAAVGYLTAVFFHLFATTEYGPLTED